MPGVNREILEVYESIHSLFGGPKTNLKDREHPSLAVAGAQHEELQQVLASACNRPLLLVGYCRDLKRLLILLGNGGRSFLI